MKTEITINELAKLIDRSVSRTRFNLSKPGAPKPTGKIHITKMGCKMNLYNLDDCIRWRDTLPPKFASPRHPDTEFREAAWSLPNNVMPHYLCRLNV